MGHDFHYKVIIKTYMAKGGLNLSFTVFSLSLKAKQITSGFIYQQIIWYLKPSDTFSV